MAFHNQALADLSDNDEQIDLAGWTSCTKQRTPPDSVVTISGARPVGNRSDDDLAASNLSAFDIFRNGDKRRRSTTPHPSPPASASFTSINRPALLASAQMSSLIDNRDFDADALALSRTEEPPVVKRKSMIPMIPMLRGADVPGPDVVDMTAGSDVVKRVFEEYMAGDGTLLYKVLFEDYSVEKVCVLQYIFYCWRSTETYVLLHVRSTLRPLGLARSAWYLPQKLGMPSIIACCCCASLCHMCCSLTRCHQQKHP